jgi:hypothetical protein
VPLSASDYRKTLARLELDRSESDYREAFLGISPETVRKQLENAYEKLGVHTRTGAVAATFGRKQSAVAT